MKYDVKSATAKDSKNLFKTAFEYFMTILKIISEPQFSFFFFFFSFYLETFFWVGGVRFQFELLHSKVKKKLNQAWMIFKGPNGIG